MTAADSAGSLVGSAISAGQSAPASYSGERVEAGSSVAPAARSRRRRALPAMTCAAWGSSKVRTSHFLSRPMLPKPGAVPARAGSRCRWQFPRSRRVP